MHYSFFFTTICTNLLQPTVTCSNILTAISTYSNLLQYTQIRSNSFMQIKSVHPCRNLLTAAQTHYLFKKWCIHSAVVALLITHDLLGRSIHCNLFSRRLPQQIVVASAHTLYISNLLFIFSQIALSSLHYILRIDHQNSSSRSCSFALYLQPNCALQYGVVIFPRFRFLHLQLQSISKAHCLVIIDLF